TIQTRSKDIEDWFSQIKPDNKVFLHFCYDDFQGKDNHLREVLKGIESKGFHNKIVLPYEGMDKKTVEKRARQKGIGESKVGVKIDRVVELEQPTALWTSKHDKIVDDYEKSNQEEHVIIKKD